MTESEWLVSEDPQAMLEHFFRARAATILADEPMPRRISDRKPRLFACACCRQVWHLLPPGGSRRAVEVAELYADGLATEEERRKADREACYAPSGMGADMAIWPCSQDGQRTASGHHYAQQVAWLAAPGIPATSLLRCIVGIPGRSLAIDPAWLAWRDGLIRQLAEAAYQERQLPSGRLDSDRLAVLADALEEAGCQDQDILQHLRCPARLHARGCHVLDLLLGKE